MEQGIGPDPIGIIGEDAAGFRQGFVGFSPTRCWSRLQASSGSAVSVRVRPATLAWIFFEPVLLDPVDPDMTGLRHLRGEADPAHVGDGISITFEPNTHYALSHDRSVPRVQIRVNEAAIASESNTYLMYIPTCL
ncbi:hypothetical protein JL101_031555 (plasmid) [Skermanella rosea]|uniref:hypothetical protein n=1 Tax=Skermanella rosea TaxID=1817965 RepID=UPI0019312649|nr:hypothetical protein [Skermanella rosea]UEM07473.1 hypothetical protein JL101_031555 [Skermanella rosea]